MSEPVVFLGPSLPVAEARAILPARYRPPVEQGAVYDAAERLDPSVIVIVDGVFARVPAVRHKEILHALDRGIPVVGAASLGALRAAELHPFGMAGHGLIYRWYRRTPFADDDEVAVAMAPPDIGAAALSEALINIRVTLRRAARERVIGPGLRQALLERARRTHFLERSYDDLIAQARATLAGPIASRLDALAAWLPGHAVDQKRQDARSLLHAIAADPPLRSAPAGGGRFVWTEAFVRDLAAAGLRGADDEQVK